MEQAPVLAATRGAQRSPRLLRLASEDQLVALVRAGEERAFEAIYDRHHRAILGFCRHMLGSREEAEDAVQHTFLAAYRDLRGSAKAIQLRPWLFAIARNRCLSVLRVRREHTVLDLAEPATEGLADAVVRREDVRELLADLARLPDDQRAALLLAELGALDHAGIATVLGCPTQKVKALVFQARSALAAMREARATPCAEIRAQLASASGAALRRGPLRRHLRDCSGCREFRTEVGRQRELLAIALPVIPTAALKAGALPGGATGGGALASAGAGAGGASLGGGAISGAGTGLGGAALGGGAASAGPLAALASTGAAKVVASLAVAGALAGGGAVGLHAVRGPAHDSGGVAAPAARAPASADPLAAPGAAATTPAARRGGPAGRSRRASHARGPAARHRHEAAAPVRPPAAGRAAPRAAQPTTPATGRPTPSGEGAERAPSTPAPAHAGRPPAAEQPPAGGGDRGASGAQPPPSAPPPAAQPHDPPAPPADSHAEGKPDR